MSRPISDDAPDLARLLMDRLPAGRAMDRLVAAVSISNEATNAADALINRVVSEARGEGHSWTEIGECLGVSKQAARKRFSDVIDPGLAQLPSDLCVMPRLTACLQTARQEAAQDDADVVGDHHLLLGLFTEGMAANALHAVGLTIEATRATARRLFPSSSARQRAAELPEIKSCYLAAAAELARARGGYLGTEHLLFVLADDPGSRTRGILTALGVSPAQIIEQLVLPPARTRRRRRRSGVMRSLIRG